MRIEIGEPDNPQLTHYQESRPARDGTPKIFLMGHSLCLLE